MPPTDSRRREPWGILGISIVGMTGAAFAALTASGNARDRPAVAELTLPAIVAFLEQGRPGMKTYINRRGIVKQVHAGFAAGDEAKLAAIIDRELAAR